MSRSPRLLALAMTAALAGPAAGVTLRSVSVTLPTGDRTGPDGPHAEAINGDCPSCPSAGMVLTQPKLSRAEWQGEVTKTIKVHHAPVEPADAALVVDYPAELKLAP